MKKNLASVLIFSVLIILSNAAFSQSSSDDKTVVATVGKKTFYLSDVKQLHQANSQLSLAPLDTVYDYLVDHLIDGYLVTQKARSIGLEKDNAVKEAMKQAEDLVLRNVYIQKEVNAKLANKDLKEMYSNFVKKNPPKELVHARHILVENEKEAEEIIKSLSNGADFIELAKEKSVGPSAPTGGDLGFFPKEAMVPEFANAAFAMKAGDFSKKPVKTQFGWHVIKVEDKKLSETPKLEELEPHLKTEYAETLIEEILKELRSKEKIKRFDLKGKTK